MEDPRIVSPQFNSPEMTYYNVLVNNYIGSFDNFDEAVAARHKAEQELHGEYACNGK